MKKFLLIAAVCAMPATTMPASAQVYFDADFGSVGANRLDDPNYGWPKVIGDADTTPTPEVNAARSERIVMPDGRVIDRSREFVLSGHADCRRNVRYWHIADMPSCTAHVRFWG